jgi:predicted TIM-barrel fold metal-dependent hydrolase
MVIDIRIKPPLRDSSTDPEVTIPDEYIRYDEMYGYGALMNITVEELVAEMETNDVTGILQAEHEWGEDEDWNNRVSTIVHAHRDRFLCGFGSVDPRRGMDAVREIERCYDELGLRGIVFQPGFLNLPPTDPRCYPIYAKCVELGIPLGLHTGVNFSASGPIDNGRPILVDRVACDFPELTIICHHGGWPWPHEAVAIAWKHPNIYLEYGAIAPKYIATGGGWGDTTRFMDTVLRSKILFGTDWPMLRYERAIGEIEQLGLRPQSHDAYTRTNAEQLLDRIR